MPHRAVAPPRHSVRRPHAHGNLERERMNAPDEEQAAREEAQAQRNAGTLLAARYRLVARLGRGQASVVYLADDMHLAELQVAVKIAVPADSARAYSVSPRDHLMNEARALVAVRHAA